mmetsp:Transcript_25271/g.37809  ORF Transcript_25271/g.37809 Transcript_25271/m.37809 type:complete len:309 (+) Transcript_25271:7-933(+)
MNDRFHQCNAGQQDEHRHQNQMVRPPTSIDFQLSTDLSRAFICAATEAASTSRTRSFHQDDHKYSGNENDVGRSTDSVAAPINVEGCTTRCFNDRFSEAIVHKMKTDEDDAPSVSSSCSASLKRRRDDGVLQEAEEPTITTRPKIIDAVDGPHHFHEKISASTAAVADSCSATSSRKSVKFDKVFIRSYNMTIAYHPSCTSGVPVGLSWEYDPQHFEMSVEAYESSRDGNRRSKSQMLIPRDIRVDLLREFNVSMREIFRANDEVERAQRKRMKALSQPRRKRREMVDRIIKTANRGFRKVVESNDIT